MNVEGGGINMEKGMNMERGVETKGKRNGNWGMLSIPVPKML
jgi:hypothetical protein